MQYFIIYHMKKITEKYPEIHYSKHIKYCFRLYTNKNTIGNENRQRKILITLIFHRNGFQSGGKQNVLTKHLTDISDIIKLKKFN